MFAGVLDEADNCPLHSNTNQLNNDEDAMGDVCDDDDDNDGKGVRPMYELVDGEGFVAIRFYPYPIGITNLI